MRLSGPFAAAMLTRAFEHVFPSQSYSQSTVGAQTLMAVAWNAIAAATTGECCPEFAPRSPAAGGALATNPWSATTGRRLLQGPVVTESAIATSVMSRRLKISVSEKRGIEHLVTCPLFGVIWPEDALVKSEYVKLNDIY